ncbi:glycosyltransferase [Mangrovimonas aestuarii]|uniref:glycosyltransferase n=1 Tax=Mangrovimonas aestuarii TaxID=3018443 RepID=UPI002378949E|nr:glycosyltransferase [Mangrovimonas aestuarii]
MKRENPRKNIALFTIAMFFAGAYRVLSFIVSYLNIETFRTTLIVAGYFRNNDLLILGSYVESFPDVLLESCMAGTPILALHAPGGIDGIIVQRQNGVFVENTMDFVKELNVLLKNFYFVPSLVHLVVEEKLDANKIISQYEALILKHCNK